MKLSFFCFLAIAMAFLFSPVVFAAEIGQTIDMPGYFTPGTGLFVTAKDPTCRDVFASSQLDVIYAKANYNYIQRLDPTEDPASIKLDFIGHPNFKGAAVLTGKAEFLRWQSADKKTGKTYIAKIEIPLAGYLTII